MKTKKPNMPGHDEKIMSEEEIHGIIQKLPKLAVSRSFTSEVMMKANQEEESLSYIRKFAWAPASVFAALVLLISIFIGSFAYAVSTSPPEVKSKIVAKVVSCFIVKPSVFTPSSIGNFCSQCGMMFCCDGNGKCMMNMDSK